MHYTSMQEMIDDVFGSTSYSMSKCNRSKTNWEFNFEITPGQLSVKEPTRIVFNGPATIAFWPDGTKTVVKCQDGEPFDPEKGVALAMLKKYFRGAKYNDVLNKLIKNATYETKK